MVYHEKVLHNYFAPCHRKYNSFFWAGIRYATHDGKVELNTVEYTTAFLISDYLHFLWHDINSKILQHFFYCKEVVRAS